MKVKVVKRFNGMDPGTVVECTKDDCRRWIAYGYVEVIKQARSPKNKMITGPEKNK